MRIQPLSEYIGAEVIGLDLRAPLTENQKATLNEAFLQHIVLVLRDQSLTGEQYRDGLANFGTPMRQHREKYNLEACPDVSIVTNRGGFGKADMWHTDHTNHENPPKITALYAVELPSSGGATWFANMYAGLDALTPSQRQQIDGLHTINNMEANPSYSAADRQRAPGGVRHPIVRTHPQTGRKSLYFHVTKSQAIDGIAHAEVRPLLESLLDTAIQPHAVYKHIWQPGDLVMADNRCAMHRAEHDYPPGEYRLLWRVILAGDKPV
jgi:taurine dioxygenase